MNPHMSKSRIELPGNRDADWRCNYCKVVGKLEALREIECSYVYPPCEFCGGTPECTLECPGIAAALGSVDVVLVGNPKLLRTIGKSILKG